MGCGVRWCAREFLPLKLGSEEPQTTYVNQKMTSILLCVCLTRVCVCVNFLCVCVCDEDKAIEQKQDAIDQIGDKGEMYGLYTSMKDLGENTFVLVLSVLLVQLWGSYILLRIQEFFKMMNLRDATNSIRSLMFITVAIVLTFYILNLKPRKVIGGVNFAKHI